MLTLEKAKEFLRVDTDYEDALIQSLIDAAVAYITDTTGMTAENQNTPLIETLQKFIVANWFENRASGGDMAGSSTILSLVKTVKSKVGNT